MADLFGNEQGGEELRPDEFYRGLSYLGKPTSITLPGQEPTPPGGQALGAAGGAPVTAPSVMGTPGAGPSAPSGEPTSALSPGIRAMLTGLSFGTRAASLGANLIPGAAAGAFETPSGQLSFSAPEALRELQFPSTMPPSGELPGASIPSGQGGTGFDISSAVGPALSALPSLFGLEEAIRTGNYGGVVSPAINLGANIGVQTGMLPAELTSLTGAGLPLAAATQIISSIIQDEIADPGGRVSAAQDAQFQMSQQVPGEAQGLQLGAAMLPLISDKLTTEQAMQLFNTARAGLKASEQLSSPLGAQGQNEAGVQMAQYPGLSEAVNQYAPQAWLAAVRLQDLLAKRGVSTPQDFQVPTEGPFAQFYGTGRPVTDPAQLAGMEPNQQAQQMNLAADLASGGYEGREQGVPGGTTYLTPAEALGKIGQYGGFSERPYGETAAGIGTPLGGYQYSPATMAALSGIQPGGLEAGIRSYLSQLPGYAGSPLASLWASPSPLATADAATAVQGGAGQGPALSYPSAIRSGEEFPFASV
jgi:hypothetical protein